MIGTLRPRRVRHALTIIAALTLMSPAAALAQCDLKAEFGGVSNPTVPTGQPASLSVRFTNLATEGACPANQVRLQRTSATGPALVAVPMAFQALPALMPQGVVLLTFQVESSLPSTHVYELQYQTPHEDANSSNHRPTRTVTFTYPAATLAVPDLTVTAVRPAGGLRVGGCNTVNVTVRNLGSAIPVETQLTLRLFGPAPAVALVERKALAVSAFAAGESRTIPVSAFLVPSAGVWRLEAVADATTVVTEANESNNTRVERTDEVSRPCGP